MDKNFEYLETIHMLTARADQVIDIIEKKLDENRGETEITVNAEALENIMELLSIHSHLVVRYVEELEIWTDFAERMTDKLES